MTYLAALVCVLGIAAGQILFKLSAAAFKAAGTILDPKGLGILMVAFLLYAVTTVGWVWVLRNVDLGRAYPMMALAFVIVPVASHFILGERFNSQYALGVALIVVGIAVAVRS